MRIGPIYIRPYSVGQLKVVHPEVKIKVSIVRILCNFFLINASCRPCWPETANLVNFEKFGTIVPNRPNIHLSEWSLTHYSEFAMRSSVPNIAMIGILCRVRVKRCILTKIWKFGAPIRTTSMAKFGIREWSNQRCMPTLRNFTIIGAWGMKIPKFDGILKFDIPRWRAL